MIFWKFRENGTNPPIESMWFLSNGGGLGWVDRHILAFVFFGAVPLSIVYDNDRCLITKIRPYGTAQAGGACSTISCHTA